MIPFKATDKWYKDAAELENDCQEISAGCSIYIPKNAYDLIFKENLNAISQRKESENT